MASFLKKRLRFSRNGPEKKGQPGGEATDEGSGPVRVFFDSPGRDFPADASPRSEGRKRRNYDRPPFPRTGFHRASGARWHRPGYWESSRWLEREILRRVQRSPFIRGKEERLEPSHDPWGPSTLPGRLVPPRGRA